MGFGEFGGRNIAVFGISGTLPARAVLRTLYLGREALS